MTDQTPPPPGAEYSDPASASPQGQPVAPGPQNGLGTTALIMGILQFFCLPGIGSILAIVLGKLGMNKAKQGLATNGGTAKAGFWLGIIGLILTVIGIIVTVVVLAFTVRVAGDAIDPVRNEQTGLGDGSYVMEPTSSLRVNERCSFGGTPTNLDTGMVNSARVTVVGRGPVQCGGATTPDVVNFTVSGGVATISSAQ